MSDLLDFAAFQEEEKNPNPLPVNRWKALEDMVDAEKDPLALFLLTPQLDLEEQVKYCDWLLWRYGALEAKLEQFIEEQEKQAKDYTGAFVAARCNEVDPGTSKLYTHAYATRLAAIERYVLECEGNALSAKRRLRLTKAYIRALISKSNKLPGRQGQANRHLEMSRDI